MALTGSSFILMYASMARAPHFAMSLASRMAATSFEASDLDGVQRWTSRYAELQSLFGDAPDELPMAHAS